MWLVSMSVNGDEEEPKPAPRAAGGCFGAGSEGVKEGGEGEHG